jgi:hypothetical protein
VIEKWREKSATDVAILVNSCIEHRAAIFPVPGGIIRTTAEERDTKWRPADYHQSSLLLVVNTDLYHGLI